eukprot:gene10693-biopygen6840
MHVIAQHTAWGRVLGTRPGRIHALVGRSCAGSPRLFDTRLCDGSAVAESKVTTNEPTPLRMNECRVQRRRWNQHPLSRHGDDREATGLSPHTPARVVRASWQRRESVVRVP